MGESDIYSQVLAEQIERQDSHVVDEETYRLRVTFMAAALQGMLAAGALARRTTDDIATLCLDQANEAIRVLKRGNR